MDKEAAIKALDGMALHLKQQREILAELQKIIEPKTPDNMNNIIIRRIVNNVGNQVMVSYEENKTTFEMIGILQRPENGKFFGISNQGETNPSTVVFHPDSVSDVLETPLEKYRVKISLDPFKSN